MGSDFASVMQTLMAVLSGLVVVLLLVGIFTLICYWFIAKKMGEPGWKGIIPYYNMYVFYHHVWNDKMFFIYLAITLVSGFVSASIASDAPAFLSLISGGLGIANLVINIMFSNYLSKSFGRSVGFTVGLVLLPIVFYPILAFGKSQYVGNTTLQMETQTYVSNYNNGDNVYTNENNNYAPTNDCTSTNAQYYDNNNQGMDTVSSNNDDNNVDM